MKHESITNDENAINLIFKFIKILRSHLTSLKNKEKLENPGKEKNQKFG